MARSKSPKHPPLSLNERRILDIIRRRGAVSRVEIAKIVDLTSASVTRIIQRLETYGLMLETTSREGKRGQPSRPLQLRPDAAYALGVDFSHKSLDVALVDFTGAIIEVASASIPDLSRESIAERTKQVSDTLLDTHRIRREALIGLGVSAPGYRVHGNELFALHPIFSPQFSRDLARDFQSRFGMRVIVERDAIASAIGESLVGHGRDRTTFGFIHLGHGIGGALMVDGHPMYGAHGNAGGVGELFPRTQPRPSGSDLLAHLQSAGLPVVDFIDLEGLDPRSCDPLNAWVERAGDQLKVGLNVFARLFDPQTIVLGGRLPTTICDALIARIGGWDRPQTYTNDLPQPALHSSTRGRLAGAQGAACLPLFETYFSLAGNPWSGTDSIQGEGDRARPSPKSAISPRAKRPATRRLVSK
jgi:predicted NBD/HSP70 family sugar kinase